MLLGVCPLTWKEWTPDQKLFPAFAGVFPPIVADYDSEKGGQPPFHPRMMLVLLLYSYSVGVFSSRKIMARCETDVAFRVIVGEARLPTHQRTGIVLAVAVPGSLGFVS